LTNELPTARERTHGLFMSARPSPTRLPGSSPSVRTPRCESMLSVDDGDCGCFASGFAVGNSLSASSCRLSSPVRRSWPCYGFGLAVSRRQNQAERYNHTCLSFWSLFTAPMISSFNYAELGTTSVSSLPANLFKKKKVCIRQSTCRSKSANGESVSLAVLYSFWETDDWTYRTLMIVGTIPNIACVLLCGVILSTAHIYRRRLPS